MILIHPTPMVHSIEMVYYEPAVLFHTNLLKKELPTNKSYPWKQAKRKDTGKYHCTSAAQPFSFSACLQGCQLSARGLTWKRFVLNLCHEKIVMKLNKCVCVSSLGEIFLIGITYRICKQDWLEKYISCKIKFIWIYLYGGMVNSPVWWICEVRDRVDWSPRLFYV